jgi:adenylate cyclase
MNLDTGPRDASDYATELVQLLDTIGDPSLTAALSTSFLNTFLQEGKFNAVLELADRVIDSDESEQDRLGLISVAPLANALAVRGTARWFVGLPGWRDDFDRHSKLSPGSRLNSAPARFTSFTS